MPTKLDPGCQVHGKNLTQKESARGKYQEQTSKDYLAEIRSEYDKWAKANLALSGPLAETKATDQGVVSARTKLFREYKDFVDQKKYAEHFDSRSNLHSSVLEEFVYYLFRDLVGSFLGSPLVGKSHSFKDIFFFPRSYQRMVTAPHAQIEKKDHDFVIGAGVDARFNVRGSSTFQSEELDLVAVAIECKTYLDKTMLEGCSTAAAQLKVRNPNSMYVVVSEWLKLTEKVNLRKYEVDQIYVLRKQKNTDREDRYKPGYVASPIYDDVVWHLYQSVRDHLVKPWGGGVKDGMERGWLMG